MIIETKYNLGDLVYYPKSVCNRIMVKSCKKCNGTGKLELVGGDSITCTECHSDLGKYDNIYTSIPYSQPSKIGKISVELYECNLLGHNDGYHYMIAATGIGTGTCHPEDVLFETYKECDEWCKKQTEKARADFKALYPGAIID